jgi:prepilin-type N-terminal cleavage/methylation domain-containing protein
MKRSFTLVEILIAVIILGIILTFAVPTYYNILEKAKSKVCEQNLNVLAEAVEIYALENDSLPASLSQLRQDHLDKAWAKILDKDSLKIKLAYYLVDLDKKGLAYAQTAWVERYVGKIKHLSCPSDQSPPPVGFSYGINGNLAGLSYNEYKVMSDMDLVADCEQDVFYGEGDLTKRHREVSILGGDEYALTITRSKNIDEVSKKRGRKRRKRPLQNREFATDSPSGIDGSENLIGEIEPNIEPMSIPDYDLPNTDDYILPPLVDEIPDTTIPDDVYDQDRGGLPEYDPNWDNYDPVIYDENTGGLPAYPDLQGDDLYQE